MSDLQDKFARILGDSVKLAEQNAIIDDQGRIEAFTHYVIEPLISGARVWKYQQLIQDFTSPRLALSWCIADKSNQYILADTIKKLDRNYRRLSDDIHVSQVQLQQIKDPVRKEILSTKVKYKIDIVSDINGRLKKCVSIAKYWQLKGFHDEIARTRRPPPNTTNCSRDSRPIWSRS